MNIEERQIEIQKQYVYEKDMRSKMLVVYVIEKEAEDIDLKLIEIDLSNFK